MHARITLEAMQDPALRRVECVERKGIGHPDTICDAIAEAISRALSRHYLERYGRILHHNVDKILLVGGESAPALGGGQLVKPIEIVLAGRATARVGSDDIPVADIALEAARNCIRANLRTLDPDRDIRWDCRIRPGSIDLTQLFARGMGTVALANDTSAGAGFAPLTAVERLVLEAEPLLSGTRRPHRACGEDVKVAACRVDDEVDLTVACAAIGLALAGPSDYLAFRSAILDAVHDHAKAVLGPAHLRIAVNGADDLDAGIRYLTVTGTSAEAGDDGETGRGNRVNGLICVGRPLTLEAAAGKNPVSHVGKLYNVLAQELAEEIVREVPDVHAAECIFASRVGAPIDQPVLAHLRLSPAPGCPLAALDAIVQAHARAALARLPSMWHRFVAGELRVY